MNPLNENIRRLCQVLLVAVTLSACGSGSNNDDEGVQAGDVFAVTQSNRLVSFSPATPQVFSSRVDLIGLQNPGEEAIVGIDFRPADGQLYLLSLDVGNTTPGRGRLYRIALDSGRLSFVSALVAAAGDSYTGLTGSQFGMDFNPVVDRLRVVSNTGQNLRINVDMGTATTTDDPLSSTGVTASAYTNSFDSATNTTLYGIDVASDRLVIQSPPNDGTIVGVGAFNTGADISDAQLDIEGQSGLALAGLTINGTAALFQVDLETGGATPLGTIGTGEPLRAMSIQSAAVAAPIVVAVTTTNRLIGFNVTTPDVLLGSVAITGLQVGENVVGIDLRPATGQLYVLGSTSRLYTLDPLTAAATEVGMGPFVPGLSGASFGFDFNPVPDRIRVVGDDRQNLRLHPDTGAVVGGMTDSTLSELSMVVGSAYTNNFAGASQTTLFGIDAGSDMLVRQGGDPGNSIANDPGNPNSGVITPIGMLGVDTTTNAGFDIAGMQNGFAYAALEISGATGSSNLYRINLNPGTGNAATLIGAIGGGEAVRAMALVP
jgi:hypothetical protein